MTSIASYSNSASVSVLADIQALSNKTQLRLTSGKKVNSITDDAVAFFRAKTLNDESRNFASDATLIKEASSLLSLTSTAISALEDLLEQALNAVVITDATARASALSALGAQADSIATSATLNSQNLITAGDASFALNSGNFAITSLAMTATVNTAAFSGFTSVSEVQTALATVRNKLAINQSTEAALTARAAFEDARIRVFEEASTNLTAADLTEESANLAALQTQQNIGFQSISLGNQQIRQLVALVS